MITDLIRQSATAKFVFLRLLNKPEIIRNAGGQTRRHPQFIDAFHLSGVRLAIESNLALTRPVSCALSPRVPLGSSVGAVFDYISKGGLIRCSRFAVSQQPAQQNFRSVNLLANPKSGHCRQQY